MNKVGLFKKIKAFWYKLNATPYLKEGGHIVRIIAGLATWQMLQHLGGQSVDECFKGSSSDYPHQD